MTKDEDRVYGGRKLKTYKKTELIKIIVDIAYERDEALLKIPAEKQQ